MIAYTPENAITTTTADTTTINSNFLTYENSDYGISIQYPVDWNKDEGITFLNKLGLNKLAEDSIVSFSPSSTIDVDFQIYIYKPNDISSFPYSNITLRELVNRQINDLRESYGFRGISSEPTSLASNPAYNIVYYGSDLESKTMEIWTLKNDKAYEIEYTAVDSLDGNTDRQARISQFSYYLPTVQQMIDSFKTDAATTLPAEPSEPQTEQQSTETQQPQSDSTRDYSGLILGLMIIMAAIAVTIAKFRHKGMGKHRERRGFPDYIKEEVLRKQNHRCAHCNRILNVVDWDHKDGNRSNNKESNCQALCPNCHAVKTRRGDR